MSQLLGTGLVLPEAEPGSTRLLLAKLRLLAVRRWFAATETLPSLAALKLRGLTRALPKLLRSEPEALRCFDAFEVSVPLLACESGALPASAALALAAPNLLLGLAERVAGRPEAHWSAPCAALASQDRGFVLEFSPPARGVTLESTELRAQLADGRSVSVSADAEGTTRPFFEVSPALPDLRLSTFDSNPLASIEAHPEKRGNRVDLGGRGADEWCAALRNSLELVRLALPALHDEMTASLRRIVPVGYEPELHLSASYREAPGLVYLTLHPNPVTLAEALIHETQHGKLNTLTFFDPVLENGHTEWAASPVRPDLRPLLGVLLAAHAFVPVAEFHRKLAQLGHELGRGEAFMWRQKEVVESNARGLDVLREKARPTELGARVLRDLELLHARALST